MRVGRVMSSRHFGAEVCPERVTVPQVMLLRALVHGPVKMSEVATMLAIKPPAASATVAALEDRGYVERSNDPHDRRVTLVTPTDAGIAALHEGEQRRREYMRRFMAVLSEDDIRRLIDIHHKLLDALSTNTI